MERTKNDAAKVNAKFNQLRTKVKEITKGMDDTLTQIDADEKGTSKIQMDFMLVQPRMKMYQAYWIVSNF
jgi:hypothetical protein